MTGRVPAVRFLQRIKSPAKRQLIQSLTLAVWNTPDCEHFTDVLIKNPRHTSHSDNRPHITLRMKTARQVADKSGQTVHVYYDEQTKEYEAFRLYPERKDDWNNDEPKEDSNNDEPKKDSNNDEPKEE